MHSPERGRARNPRTTLTRRHLPPPREGLLCRDVDLAGLRAARRQWEEARGRQVFIQSTR